MGGCTDACFAVQDYHSEQMKLRYYQQEAIDSLYDFFRKYTDNTRHPVLALPTGTGKGVIIAGFISGVMKTWPGQRVLMLTHVKELIEQNAAKMREFWPQAPLGIYSAGMGSKNASMPITFAGIQSAQKHPDQFGWIDLIIIDECHLVSPKDNTGYQKFIKELRKINPNLRVIGLSATPYRLGLGMITDGGIFTDICYDITGLHAFNRLIDEGYLCPLIPMPTDTVLDVSGVHKQGGEFDNSELQEAVVKYDITKKALEEAWTMAANRKHWLVFAAGIDHVRMIVQILEEMGISARGIHSKMTPIDGDRDENVRMFLAGEIQVLVNADILTTGFDFPGLDCIILLRPTSSPGLHVQILGRGTRPFYAPGFDLEILEQRLAAISNSIKQNCLVLDFAGNTMRLGPINDPRIPKKKGASSGDIPIKICNECGCMNHISARFCIQCGMEFTFQEKITPKASTLALIVRDEPEVALFDVDKVTYQAHVKPFYPPTLKVNYYCGIRRFTEYICLEHHGNPIRTKAIGWWKKRSEAEVPNTIQEALPDVEHLRTPVKIRVWVNRKHPDILMHLFQEDLDALAAKEPTNA